MRYKRMADIILLDFLVIVLLVTIAFFPSSIIHNILGVSFVILFIGYVMVAALFPRRGVPSGIERAALSFVLSLTMVGIIGLIVNYTPWGVSLESLLTSTTVFIFAMSAIAWIRRSKLSEEESFGIRFHLALPRWRGVTRAKIPSFILTVIMVLAALAAMGTLGYTLAAPKSGESFTEFYIITLEGKARDYPEKLAVGEHGKVVVVILNNEYEAMTYRLEVRIDGIRNSKTELVSLEHGEKWEGDVTFTPTVAGDEQVVDFVLYKEGEVEPYFEPLRLWIDVAE